MQHSSSKITEDFYLLYIFLSEENFFLMISLTSAKFSSYNIAQLYRNVVATLGIIALIDTGKLLILLRRYKIPYTSKKIQRICKFIWAATVIVDSTDFIVR